MATTTVQDKRVSRPKTMVLSFAAIAAIAFVAWGQPDWSDRPLRIVSIPNALAETEPGDFEVRPQNAFVDVFHSGCDETYRYDVVETTTEIRVHAEVRVQPSYNFCERQYQERLELDEPIGNRRIIDVATGNTLHPLP